MTVKKNTVRNNEKKNLPKGWIKIPLEKIALLINGRAFKPKDWSNEGLPIVRIQNLNDQSKSFNYCNFEVAEKFLIDNGQLLFAWSGTPNTSFGCFIWNRGKAVLNQHIFRVEINENYLNKQFINYAINQNLDKYISKAHGGVGLRHITKGKFEEEILSIPSLPEQHRIVSKIESIFSQIDAAKEKLEALASQAKSSSESLSMLKSSVLKQAFEGRLVPQDPNDESAEVLLMKIHNNSKDLVFEKKNLPKGWIKTEIRFVINPSKDRFDPITNKNKTFIGLEHIESNTGKIIGKGESKNLTSTKTIFRSGDILYGRLRPYLNKVCVPNFNGVCSTDILVFKKNSFLSNRFIALFFTTNCFVTYANANMTGVQHPRINFKKISIFTISLPPLNEQKRIVSKIESIFDKIDAIEKQVDDSLINLDQLKKSTLKEAFEGKLVPQDPNDEPAEILLQKIQQEKQLIQNTKPKRGKKDVK